MFNFFKRKRRATLKDRDEMTIAEVESLEKENVVHLENIHNEMRKQDFCDKCSSKLIVVKPEVWMGNRILCECEKCKERCYRSL